MEEFIAEVEAYAESHGILPSTVVQKAKCGNGGTWSKWISSTKGGPGMHTVDRLREYMAANPAKTEGCASKAQQSRSGSSTERAA